MLPAGGTLYAARLANDYHRVIISVTTFLYLILVAPCHLSVPWIFPNYFLISELHGIMCLFSDSDLICIVPFVFPGCAIIPTLPILFLFFNGVVTSFRPYPYFFSFSMGAIIPVTTFLYLICVAPPSFSVPSFGDYFFIFNSGSSAIFRCISGLLFIFNLCNAVDFSNYFLYRVHSIMCLFGDSPDLICIVPFGHCHASFRSYPYYFFQWGRSINSNYPYNFYFLIVTTFIHQVYYSQASNHLILLLSGSLVALYVDYVSHSMQSLIFASLVWEVPTTLLSSRRLHPLDTSLFFPLRSPPPAKFGLFKVESIGPLPLPLPAGGKPKFRFEFSKISCVFVMTAHGSEPTPAGFFSITHRVKTQRVIILTFVFFNVDSCRQLCPKLHREGNSGTDNGYLLRYFKPITSDTDSCPFEVVMEFHLLLSLDPAPNGVSDDLEYFFRPEMERKSNNPGLDCV
ncbi:hypothetical protein H5410_053827, partial [Solanum commersonii]